jgi:hypothetical protein
MRQGGIKARGLSKPGMAGLELGPIWVAVHTPASLPVSRGVVVVMVVWWGQQMDVSS